MSDHAAAVRYWQAAKNTAHTFLEAETAFEYSQTVFTDGILYGDVGEWLHDGPVEDPDWMFEYAAEEEEREDYLNRIVIVDDEDEIMVD